MSWQRPGPCIGGAGEVLFGTDSHTCNAGAFGQFATGIGNTDAGFILGTGKLLIKVWSSARMPSCPHHLPEDCFCQRSLWRSGLM